MSKVIIIGCGGVGTVVAYKCAQNPDVFTEIVLASRTKSKCDALAAKIGAPNITTDRVDADNVDDIVALFERHKPRLVINVVLKIIAFLVLAVLPVTIPRLLFLPWQFMVLTRITFAPSNIFSTASLIWDLFASDGMHAYRFSSSV